MSQAFQIGKLLIFQDGINKDIVNMIKFAHPDNTNQ